MRYLVCVLAGTRSREASVSVLAKLRPPILYKFLDVFSCNGSGFQLRILDVGAACTGELQSVDPQH